MPHDPFDESGIEKEPSSESSHQSKVEETWTESSNRQPDSELPNPVEATNPTAEQLRGEQCQIAIGVLHHMGMESDPHQPPFKAYRSSKGERFFIQAGYKNGEHAVGKVSGVDEQSNNALKREAYLTDFANQLLDQSRQQGVGIPLELPRKLAEYHDEYRRGMVVNFIDQDQDLSHLTDVQKVEVCTFVLKSLNALPLSDAMIERARQEGIIKVHDSRKIIEQWHYYLTNLAQDGALTEAEVQELIPQIYNHRQQLSQLPLKFVHGDLHGSNIALSTDQQTGFTKVALMDLEAARISNEFATLAQLGNLARTAEVLHQMPPQQKADTFGQDWADYMDHVYELYSAPGTLAQLEQAMGINEQTAQDRQRKELYILMRIDNLIERMYWWVGKTDFASMAGKREYAELVREQLAQLKALQARNQNEQSHG